MKFSFLVSHVESARGICSLTTVVYRARHTRYSRLVGRQVGARFPYDDNDRTFAIAIFSRRPIDSRTSWPYLPRWITSRLARLMLGQHHIVSSYIGGAHVPVLVHDLRPTFAGNRADLRVERSSGRVSINGTAETIAADFARWFLTAARFHRDISVICTICQSQRVLRRVNRW